MDELNKWLTPESEIETEPTYNRHYITTDAQGRVTGGWSDGPHPDRDTTDAICINEHGGYQFRMICSAGFAGDAEFPPLYKTEENPPLYNMDGIPLYKWDGQAVQPRTEEEIEADREAIPAPPPSPQEQLRADVDYIAAMTGVEL